MKIERRTTTITKENTMKYGFHQTVTNAVCYYHAECNIAVIVEQLSNYYSMLQEKKEIEEHGIQHKHQSSEVNNHESKFIAFATAHAPTMIEEEYEGDDNVCHNDWIKPKKTVST